MARIAHLSDVHFGAEESAVVEGAVVAVERFAPDVVVVSGDLTQRAHGDQFHAARAFLDRLGTIGTDLVVVPGNHDLPLYDLVRRAFDPRGRFRRIITRERAPFVQAAGAAVLGLDTSRPEVWKNGELEDDDVAEITRRLRPLPATVLKVVVTHHPFVPPPARPEARIVVGAAAALDAASAAGVDLLLSGHRHTAHRADVRVAHPKTTRGMLLVMAGTATSHRRRDEPNSWTAIDGDSERLTVTDHRWDGTAFAPGTPDRYARTEHGWHPA
jgi:3',5'-cyclic AMP phosphodiesterase CpdA